MAYDITTNGSYSSRPANYLSLYVRQDWLEEANNRRTYAWQLSAQGGGSSYVLDAKPWAADIGSNWGGPVYSGNHNLDFRGVSSILISAGATGWINADSNGYINLVIHAWHNVGSVFGNAATGTPVLYSDRIPKPPSKAPAPTFSNVTPTTMNINLFYPDTDNGAPVTGWLVRILNAKPDNTTSDYRTSTNPFPVTGLQPGKTYNVQIAATNRMGDGPMSDIRSVKMLSGAYVGANDIYQGVEVFVGSGGSYVLAEIYVPDGAGNYVLAQ